MEIKEDDYVLGVWFLSWGTADWMATAIRNENGGFNIEYRFRYYAGTNDPFDGEDKKSWYKASTDDKDEVKLIAKLTLIMEMMENARPEKCKGEMVLIRGGSKEFMEAIKDKDWANVKAAN